MNEIEEFLKRAAAMRAQQAQQSQPQQPRRPPVTQRPLAPIEPIMDAEVIEAEEVSAEDISRGVARHLDSTAFDTRASSFADGVRASDDVIESHMHQVFEHRLGQLGSTTSMVADSTLDDQEAANKEAPRSADAFDLREMIRSPQGIRNAILFSELLNPPHHRWT